MRYAARATPAPSIDERPLLFSAGDDAIIRVHDLETGEPRAVLVGHDDAINALTDLGEGMVASGSNDGTIRIWRTADGVPLGPALHTDEDTINCLAVLPSLDPDNAGPLIAGAGDDGRLQTWGPVRPSLLDSKPLPARIRALHPHNDLLVACFGWEVAVLR